MAINTQVHTTTASTVAASRHSTGSGISRRKNVSLWALQGGFAALFLFAGVSKAVMPADQVTEANPYFTIEFLRFIGLCEVLGAVGLVLPWLIRVKPVLTPTAAACLAIIMIGATVTVALTMSPALALVDLAFAAGLWTIVTGRRDYATRSR